MTPPQSSPVSLGAVVRLFLKLGLVAFGGPAVHVALMRREVITRGWLDEATFARMFAACNLIPGPSSTELAVYIGYRVAGPSGLAAAAVCFITPAMLIMLALALAYQRVGQLGPSQSALLVVRPVVVAIVLWALWDFGRRLLGSIEAAVLALLAAAAFLLGVSPVSLLLAAGAAMLLVRLPRRSGQGAALLGLVAAGGSLGVGRLPVLFATFLKIGAVSFGSGYVLIAFLQSDFVSGLHWLSLRQLLDAVAIGQATPGPVFTTATFIGYLVAGVPGAVLATVAIFLPGVALVPFLGRIVALVESSWWAEAFLQGVNGAAVGLIAGAEVRLAQVSLVSPITVAALLLSIPLVFWRPTLAPALIVGGGLIGLAVGMR